MATRVISTKLSVDGESEFKRQMGDVNSHLKTLKSEMTLVTAEFKGQANTLDALTAKDKVLREQLDQQREKMRALEEAVKEAAEAYGEQDKRTDSYKQSLNMAKTAVANLSRELADNEKYMDEARKSTDGCAKSIDSFGKEVKDIDDTPNLFKQLIDSVDGFNKKIDAGQEKIAKIGDVIKSNIVSKAVIGGFKALASAMGEIVSVSKETILAASETADSIDKTSQRVGLSAEEYQKWIYAANLSGIDESKVEDLAKTQQTYFANAKNGYSAVSDVVARLGYDLEELGGGAYYMDELREVFDSWIKEIDTGGEKMWDAYEALEAIGISANDLERQEPDKLFEKFVSGLTKARDSANDATAAYDALGINITEITDSGDAFNQVIAALADMEDVTRRNALASQIFGENYVSLAPLLNGGSEAIQAAKNEIEELGGVMSNEAVAAGAAFQDSLTRLQTAFDGLKNNLAVDFLPSVTEIMDGMTLVMRGNVDEGMAAIEQGLQNFQTQLQELGPLAEQALDLLVSVVTENLPEIIEMGTDVLTAMITGISEQMPELVPVVVDCVLTIVEALIDNIDLIIEGAFKLALGIGEGLIKAIPDIGKKIPDIIRTIREGLLGALDSIKQVGRDLIGGLWSGLEEKFTSLKEKVFGLGDRFVGWIEEKFHINSPSKVMRDRIGRPLAEGIDVGFEDEMVKRQGKMIDTIPSNFEVMAKLNTNLKPVKTGISVADLDSRLQTASAMSAAQQGDINVNITTTLDGEVVARTTTKVQRRKAKTYGKPLATA